MTIRSLTVAILLVLAVLGLLSILSYLIIALIAAVIFSFVLETLYCHAEDQAAEWATRYAEGVVTHLQAELAKIQPQDEAKLHEILRRHILDALMHAVRT